MAAQADFSATSTWADMAATVTGIASTESWIQNKTKGAVLQLFEGGGSAPASDDYGIILQYGEVMKVNNANVWVRSPQGAKVGSQTVA